MLKVQDLRCEILPSNQSKSKPTVTWAEAKRHLHDVRLRRQNQLALNINECHKLQTLHKQIFEHSINSNSTIKSYDNIPIKSMNNSYSLHTNKYTIPRIEYASILYKKAMPAFEIEASSNLEDNMPIVEELRQYLSEATHTISNDKPENTRSLSKIKNNHRRLLSVSPVSSADKRANKVYEKWPDYNQISEIVGYRIDPPPPNQITSNSTSSHRCAFPSLQKPNKSIDFSTASKQIKNAINLNPPQTPPRRKISKTKQSKKINEVSPTIGKSLPIIEKILSNNPIGKVKPTLPAILCPSSKSYSVRIQTRQWLMKNNFSSNAIRTLPLI